jgi:hypothetical protein
MAAVTIVSKPTTAPRHTVWCLAITITITVRLNTVVASPCALSISSCATHLLVVVILLSLVVVVAVLLLPLLVLLARGRAKYAVQFA